MSNYLDRLNRLRPDQRWRQVQAWLKSEPLELFAELRAGQPILKLDAVTLVTRFDECLAVFRRSDAFGVDLYANKMGDYWMGSDDTERHWREKSLMRVILDRRDLAELRTAAGSLTHGLLAGAGGSIEAVNGLARLVAAKIAEKYFGVIASPSDLQDLSYWNQQNSFYNQSFHERTNSDEIKQGVIDLTFTFISIVNNLIETRNNELDDRQPVPDDALTRLVKLRRSGALPIEMPIEATVGNIMALVIAMIEPMSHAAIHALEFFLLRRKDLLAEAKAAAQNGLAAFDGYVFEALRFRPAFQYHFRLCKNDTTLGSSQTIIKKDEVVLAVTHSAMHDPEAIAAPDVFNASRSRLDMFHFGHGLHECLGRAIAAEVLPEIVRQCLLLDGLKANKPIDYADGPVPQKFYLQWT